MTGAREQPAERIADRDDLPHSEATQRFKGHLHGDANVSFFLIDAPRGGGPGLHTHPYEEVFVIQEGEVTFTVGGTTIEAKGGQMVVVPAGVPHKYVNSGAGRARHIDIHASGRTITEWRLCGRMDL